MRIIFGIIVIIGGLAMSIGANWLTNNVGRIGWAEKYLGLDGGTRLAYVLMGIGLSILGVLIATNAFTFFLISVVGPYFGGLRT